jgi:mannitol-1-phosphate 5-dehydrogenase
LTLLQFGAGNIGRSFIGQLFARAGYEVCFVDVDPCILEALNTRHEYVVEIRDEPPGQMVIRGVRGVDARDADAVVAEIVRADIAGTAVGSGVLPRLYPVLARAVEARAARGRPPLDVILCENLRNAAAAVREGLAALLPEWFPLDGALGLVETSVGKMVPLMSESDRARDPLLVYAEAYNTLICDAAGFRNGVPPVPGLDAKARMAPYVDRKLFVHNLGHAAAAYIGNVQCPDARLLWEVVDDPVLRAAAREAMSEGGRALMAEYPGEFTHQGIDDHIDDLLRRFGNRALGDTIYRVGRDLPRKLARDDRLVGALLLGHRHGVAMDATALAAACALHFGATDEDGSPFADDAAVVERARSEGPEATLSALANLSADDDADCSVAGRVARAYGSVAERIRAGRPVVPDLLRAEER